MIVHIIEPVDNLHHTYQFRVSGADVRACRSYLYLNVCVCIPQQGTVAAPPGTPKARAYPKMADPTVTGNYEWLST
jgi:hypothetical protein